MMKQVKFKFPVRIAAILFGLFLSVGAFAQSITVNGHVKDATGEPIIGATEQATVPLRTSTVTSRLTVIKVTNCKCLMLAMPHRLSPHLPTSL